MSSINCKKYLKIIEQHWPVCPAISCPIVARSPATSDPRGVAREGHHGGAPGHENIPMKRINKAKLALSLC